jgi:hypothetical protein
MNRLKMSAVLLGVVSACFAPVMQANGHDKETILTIAEPLQVQNTVLQPGRYVFKLANQKVVSIYNADGMRPAGTVIASSAYRADPTSKTVFTFSERQGSQPTALKSWFYPGDNFGVEFSGR